MSTSPRVVAVVTILTTTVLAAVLVALLFWHSQEAASGIEFAVPRGKYTVLPADLPSVPTSHATTGERRAAFDAEDRVATIHVSSLDGRPLAGVGAYSTAQLVIDPQCETEPIALTDVSGTLYVPCAPESSSFSLWKRGFVPLRMVSLQARGEYEARLEPAVFLDMKVVNLQGRPVPGFVVAATTVSVPAQRVPQNGSASLLVRSPAKGGTSCIAESDAAGRLRLTGLSPGRYYLQCNMTNLPVWVVNARACILAQLPGPPKEIIVGEFWGAAVTFVGDLPIIISVGPVTESPFRYGIGSAVNRALKNVRRELRERFHGAFIVAGKPKNPNPLDVQLFVFGRTSGWSTHRILLHRLSTLKEEVKVSLPNRGQDLSAVVRVIAEDSQGRDLALDGAAVTFGWEDAKRFFTLRAEFGKDTRIPAGKYSLIPAGELPPSAFERVHGMARPGERKQIRVKIERPLHRYGIRVLLANGQVPFSVGLALDGNGLGFGTKFINLLSNSYTFLSPERKHEIRVTARGYKRFSGKIVRSKGRMEDGIEFFDVELSDVQLRD